MQNKNIEEYLLELKTNKEINSIFMRIGINLSELDDEFYMKYFTWTINVMSDDVFRELYSYMEDIPESFRFFLVTLR